MPLCPGVLDFEQTVDRQGESTSGVNRALVGFPPRIAGPSVRVPSPGAPAAGIPDRSDLKPPSAQGDAVTAFSPKAEAVNHGDR